MFHTVLRRSKPFLQWSSALVVLCGAMQMAQAQSDTSGSAATDGGSQSSSNSSFPSANNVSGAIMLGNTAPSGQSSGRTGAYGSGVMVPMYRPDTYVPNEFERYVQEMADKLGTTNDNADPSTDSSSTGANSNVSSNKRASGRQVRRFGANLITDAAYGGIDLDPLPQAPADYIVNPGDTIDLSIWGSANADLHLVVDRGGRISVPRIGAIPVAGVKQSELNAVISKYAGQTFRNFQVSATVGQLRSIRVFVAGYVQHPGSINVSSLSSVLHVLMKAGGPSNAGTFRNIALRRGGKIIAKFDLYDLLLRGDRAADEVVQPDDVIYVGPVGAQVGLLGSVNQPAIFELKSGETLDDVIGMAGGFNAVADRTHVSLQRLADRNTDHVTDLSLATASGGKTPMSAGDIVQVYSAIAAEQPKDRQNKRVHVDGEVLHPGDFVLPPNSTIADAIQAAGGLAPSAFVYGTRFTRQSVREIQQQNYDRALRDLQTDLAKNSSTRRVGSEEEAKAYTASQSATSTLVERLRQIRPTGRVVLPLTPDSTHLPNMPLEDGDSITIPPQGTSVGVFGSVFNAGSFVYANDRSVDYYLKQAGGPSKGADPEGMFLIRANGSVVSYLQVKEDGGGKDGFKTLKTLPGDTVFVPEEMNKTTGVQDAKDWTQILYQFGLGMAGLAALGL
jgi:protein involved in polysaccharide export with SLBB domain